MLLVSSLPSRDAVVRKEADFADFAEQEAAIPDPYESPTQLNTALAVKVQRILVMEMVMN